MVRILLVPGSTPSGSTNTAVLRTAQAVVTAQNCQGPLR
jgi:hypothetical protein